LQCSTGALEFCFQFFSYPLGSSAAGGGFIIWVAELVWEASFAHLEFNSFVFNVDGVAGKDTRTFEDATSSLDQLLGIFVNSLFDWSRIWGFTTAKTVTDLVVSLHSAYSPINML
jgi:hypothetical protein